MLSIGGISRRLFLLFGASVLIGLLAGNLWQGLSSNPDIILITIETVRADHVGPCYGYSRDTMPALCDVADDGILFREAYSQGSKTSVAIPSLLTGRWPSAVGLPKSTYALDPRTTTVFEALPERYDSYKIEDYETTMWGNDDHGIDSTLPSIHSLPEEENPSMLWAFIKKPHVPFRPERRFRKWDDLPQDQKALEELQPSGNATNLAVAVGDRDAIALYDAELRQADARIRQIVEELERRGDYHDAMIVITSDHGIVLNESLPGTRRFQHGWRPFDQLTRVPLVVKFPGNMKAGTRVETPVRHLDVAGTILSLAGSSFPGDVPGQTLRPAITGSGDTGPIVSADRPHREWMLHTPSADIHVYHPNLACNTSNPRIGPLKLYPNGTPPDMSHRFPRRLEEGVDTICKVYQKGLSMPFEPQNVSLSAAQQQQLRELGYLAPDS